MVTIQSLEPKVSSKSEIPALLLPTQPAVSGRTELQQRQKQSSREKLLAAAYDAFAESSYAGAAVDDIVKRAGVNRSTFYRHFDSKFAMTKALFDQFWPRLFAEYDAVRPSDPITDGDIDRWVEGLIGFYRANRPFYDIIVQIASLEPEGMQWEETIRQAVIRMLGERFPAFARASAPDASADARLRVRMLMIQFEFCVFDLAFRPNTDHAAIVAFLGEQFRGFLARSS
ncbi:MAG: TetR family transcriptional regulator [Rhodospirillales bacterium]|nr:TetR family transcriptional regulator [Rhodospirillales bacterium]